MKKCDCYRTKDRIIGWLGPDEVIKKEIHVCDGTKEQDECTCGGDRTKCDFYPEIREKAQKELENIVTNADRIRAMNNDELANLFDELTYTGACNDFGITPKRECDSNCVECIKEWLGWPVKL